MNIPSFCWSPCTKLILAYTCVRTISCNCIVINFAPLNPKPISLKKKKNPNPTIAYRSLCEIINLELGLLVLLFPYMEKSFCIPGLLTQHVGPI